MMHTKALRGARIAPHTWSMSVAGTQHRLIERFEGQEPGLMQQDRVRRLMQQGRARRIKCATTVGSGQPWPEFRALCLQISRHAAQRPAPVAPPVHRYHVSVVTHLVSSFGQTARRITHASRRGRDTIADSAIHNCITNSKYPPLLTQHNAPLLASAKAVEQACRGPLEPATPSPIRAHLPSS